MIEEKDLTAVGKFQRTHALKGELNMILDIDPEFLEGGVNPMIVEMDGCFIPFYAGSIRTKGVSSYLVKIDRIDSEEQARQFVNKTIFVLRSELKEYMLENDEVLIDNAEWDGFDVYDKELGELGTLKRIDDSTVNVLLVIDTPAGDELYVPFVEEFIDEVDPEKKTIILNIPEGLVDINKKKDE